jgi:hypothetical protein
VGCSFWLASWGGGEGERGPGGGLLEQELRGEATTPYLIDGQSFDMGSLLLLPNTRRQREEGCYIARSTRE